MRPPPSLARFPAFPVVTMLSLVAIFVTGAVKLGKTEIEPFMMSALAFEGQPWRLVADTLPHANLVHLLFNVYWLWILATRLEEELGHVTTIVVIVVLAVGSSAAQFAFSDPGIGLSGVGYGIVGYLAVARRIDPRLRDGIDSRTLQVFAAWFVLCIALTMANVMPIGNWAHGAGFILGAPLAYAVTPGRVARRVFGLLVTAILVAGFLGAAAIWRPQVNLSSDPGLDERFQAARAIENKDIDGVIYHLERAIELNPKDEMAWFNYGVALTEKQGHMGVTALDAFRKAMALDPKDASFKNAVAYQLVFVAGEADERGDIETAERLYRESLAIKETAEATWNLAVILDHNGKHDEAQKLFARGAQLDPEIAKTHSKPANNNSLIDAQPDRLH